VDNWSRLAIFAIVEYNQVLRYNWRPGGMCEQQGIEALGAGGFHPCQLRTVSLLGLGHF
jgi:hypothetical protein